jgi:hypothetical protein
MVSPHLLKVVESFSTSIGFNQQDALSIARHVFNHPDVPVFFFDEPKKKATWCHMVYGQGPKLKDEEADASELIVIWWSEMSPDTSRVLNIVDWERHAKDVQF